MGFPWLKGSHRQRVELANQIYLGTADFCELLTTLRIPWTIENPTNSWFWELPCMTRLLSLGHMCDLHACAYGGSRPKLTSFLGTVPGLESLSKFCPGDHEHRPWGVDEKGQSWRQPWLVYLWMHVGVFRSNIVTACTSRLEGEEHLS